MSQNDEIRQGIADLQDNTSQLNQLRFFVEQTVREMLNTSCLVRVDEVTGGGVSPAGTVSATPLVAQTDAHGNILPMASIARMPFHRVQGGIAALIVDPVPGDQAVAVFTKADSSNVQVGTQDPVRPGSYRSFDQADGMLFSGVQNQAPLVWIHIKQDKTIVIHAPEGCTIETDKNVTVNAGQEVNVTAGASVSITAPQIALNGALTMQNQNGGTTTATLTGTLNATDDLTASGISLNSHTHTGVQTGGGSTGGPQ